MKTYPLDLVEIACRGEGYFYLSKGHHPVEVFWAAIKEEFDELKEVELNSSEIKHAYSRVVWVTDMGDSYQALIPAEPRRQGSFPITLFDPKGLFN